MPWYLFQTPQGQWQLFANTPQQAATMFFQQTGIAASVATVGNGDSPLPGVPFLSIGSGGTGGLGGAPPQTAQPVTSPPGLQPPAGATGLASGDGTVGSRTFTGEDSGLGRSGAFRRALAGRGIDTGTLAGRSVLGQQGQFEDVFDVLQALGRAPGGERAFETFSGQQDQPFAQALGLLQALGRGEYGQGGLTDQLRALLSPGSAEEIGGTARLGQAALRGQVGAFGSNPFLQGAVGRLPEEFAALPQSRQQAMPFFQFLRSRIGI